MRSGNGKNMTYMDLNTVNLLMALSIVDVLNIHGDHFTNTISIIEEGKKMIVTTSKSKFVCSQLPF